MGDAVEFVCKKIVEKDGNGIPTMLGLRWTKNATMNRIRRRMALFGLVVPTLLLLWLGMSFPSAWGGQAALIMALGLALWFAVVFAVPTTERVIRFHADGRVETPLGLPHEGPSEWRLSVSDIRSIEVTMPQFPKPEELRREVRVYMDDGDTYILSTRLTEAEAFKVARMMTLVLNEMASMQPRVFFDVA